MLKLVIGDDDLPMSWDWWQECGETANAQEYRREIELWENCPEYWEMPDW